jgi:hypothetical protein
MRLLLYEIIAAPLPLNVSPVVLPVTVVLLKRMVAGEADDTPTVFDWIMLESTSSTPAVAEMAVSLLARLQLFKDSLPPAN